MRKRHRQAPAAAIQNDYYTRTAPQYDDAHGAREPEHNIALNHIAAMIGLLRIRRVLDVGCGTGRGVEYLRRINPELQVIGIDPVQALLEVGASKGIPRAALVRGDACALPFADRSFDAVMELGVLHHVPHPDQVVREMMRVSRRAVFISDGNLFGQGSAAVRILKFALYKAGLWRAVKAIQTRGRGYTITSGDGLAYSYSIYFQYRMLASWADRISVTQLGQVARPPLMPPMDCGCVLLGAVRGLDLDQAVEAAPSAADRAGVRPAGERSVRGAA